MRNPILPLAATGAGAGLLAWLVSEPFARTAAVDGTRVGNHAFTLGSFFGWFAHLMLGALVCGLLSFAISLQRTTPLRALAHGALGAALGGFAGWATDAGSDAINIRILRSGTDPSILMNVFWHLVVSVALALCIAVSTHPTPARLLRALMAGLAGAFLGFVAELVLSPLSAILMIARSGVSLQNLESVALWQPFDPSRLVERMALGIVLGLALGLSQVMARQGWLRRSLGRNEGRDYPLEAGPNRIGSAEGIEVPVRGDPGIAPVHAHIVPQGPHWFLIDAGSGRPTLLDGVPVQGQAPLAPGARIGVGNAVLEFHLSRPQGGFVPMPLARAEAVRPTPTVATRQPRLVDPSGFTFPLRPGISVIGRDPSAEVFLSHDSTVSRRHAQIEVGSAGTVLRDLGSANGTRVNDVWAAGEKVLKDGDRVQFGAVTLVYQE